MRKVKSVFGRCSISKNICKSAFIKRWTFKPEKANIKFKGYGNITTGAFGEDNSTINESRIYQEALFPTKIGERFYLNHRLRYEQRFVEEQSLRTRYR